MNDKENEQKPKKVFISYSWSSEDHQKWVVDLAERLVSDGIDVVIDVWSLEDGHDVYAFMEKMVNDPEIDRVIIISDSAYAKKANERKGGVGTETQIISKEVFESITQTKFIAVLKDRGESGEALLPTYIGSRLFIDFSDSSIENEGYERLIRNIYERPQRKKPALGKPPSHIFTDDDITLACKQKSRRLKEVLNSGRGSLEAAFDDFSEALVLDLESLRMAFEREQSETWCERLQENVSVLQEVRNSFVDAIIPVITALDESAAATVLSELMERLMPLERWPIDQGSHFECSEDNYKFFLYESFLYLIAACISKKKFSVARAIIDYRYLVPRNYGGEDTQVSSYSGFNNHATSIEKCGERRLSVMADLVKNGANRRDIRFADLMQADSVIFLAKESWGWFPRTLVYAEGTRVLPLFARAVDERGLTPLKALLGISTGQELVSRIESESVAKVLSDIMFRWGRFSMDIFNLEELKHVHA